MLCLVLQAHVTFHALISPWNSWDAAFIRTEIGFLPWLDNADHRIASRGRLVKDRTTKEPKLNCRNWECGVMVPVPAEHGGRGPLGMDVFQGHVPVPMETPGDKYGDKRPWFYSDPQ